MLAGCASTTVETTGTKLKAPLCRPGGEKVSALVFWGPRWRPDQKEPARREAAALRGIEDFFSGTTCLSHVDVRRYADDSSAEEPTDADLLRLATGAALAPDRIVLIVVRELGPTLLVGSQAIVEGHTEVDIEVRVLDAKTSQPMAAVRTRWRDGGALVVKGVGTLDKDMSAALRSTLTAPAGAP